MNAISFIDLCINQYFKLHKKKFAEEQIIEEDLDKTKKSQEISILITPPNISPEKISQDQEGSPENPQIHELFFQLETQKYQIEDLKSTIQKLQNENQFVRR